MALNLGEQQGGVEMDKGPSGCHAKEERTAEWGRDVGAGG